MLDLAEKSISNFWQKIHNRRIMFNILVINPNSSAKVTKDIQHMLVSVPSFNFDFYTAPADAPAEIDGIETSNASEAVVFPDLLTKDLLHYDGYLICCYSDHPLIYSLSRHVKKPCMGIMQASLLYSLSNPSVKKSIIVTSFPSWEPILDDAIKVFWGSDVFPRKMAATKSLNINVTNLNDPILFDKVSATVRSVVDHSDIDCVLLGCAGMAGLDTKLSPLFPNVKFVDSVKIGVEFLTSLVRYEAGPSNNILT